MSVLIDPGPPLSRPDFQRLRDMINQYCGIYMRDDAVTLARRRLRYRLEELGIPTFAEYCRYLARHESAEQELEYAAELMTNNETYFFRELHQLTAFSEELLPRIKARAEARNTKQICFWSAGCASGEEVYTIAMLVDASGLFDGWNVRVFGNDISTKALRRARSATYGASSFRSMQPQYSHYFEEVEDGRQVIPRIRSMCTFGHMNLMNREQATLVGRVDAVFCRNVFIYFDETSRRQVLETMYERLITGGYLLLGHSESLLHMQTAFEIVQLTKDLVYKRPEHKSEPPRRRAG